MSEIVTSFVQSFGSDADGLVVMELNSVANDDKTSFQPKDIINFLIHFDESKLNLIWVKPTDGHVSMSGTSSFQRSVDSTLWINEKSELSLSYITTSLKPTWYGNSGSLRLLSDIKVEAYNCNYPALSKVEFPVKFYKGILYTPDVTLLEKETYPIAIVAHFEER
jgi:hypothetical protein